MIEQEILEKWQKEQLDVASKCKILQDDISSRIQFPSSTENTTTEFCQINCCTKDKLFGGVDVSFGPNNKGIAVYVILKNLEVIYEDELLYELKVPYQSSYLAFREIDPIVSLIEKQKLEKPELTPECILVDGNGILHERRAGLATFVGVRTGIATIGVGKSMYCTEGLSCDSVDQSIHLVLEELLLALTHLHQEEENIAEEYVDGRLFLSTFRISSENSKEGETNSSSTDMKNLLDQIETLTKYDGIASYLETTEKEVIGAVLIGHGGKITKKYPRQRTKIPIYVSIGHMISLQDAIGICASLSLAKVPEPVRQADLRGREMWRNQS